MGCPGCRKPREIRKPANTNTRPTLTPTMTPVTPTVRPGNNTGRGAFQKITELKYVPKG